MTIHPIETVYQSLTRILESHLTGAIPVDGNCSCCGRPATSFGSKGFRYKNSYGDMVTHCTPCESFFVSAPEVMGVENPKKPNTGQKFGMWSGVGAIIEPTRTVLLAPPGVTAKLPPVFFQKVNVVEATTGQHLQYLFNNPLNYPAIYIKNFGRKTSELIRSLRFSFDENGIYACTDDLMTPQNEVSSIININKAKEMYGLLQDYSKKDVDKFISIVSSLAYARISPENASDEFRKNNMLPLLRALPADPHRRLSLLSLLRKV